eukprot:g113.t1
MYRVSSRSGTRRQRRDSRSGSIDAEAQRRRHAHLREDELLAKNAALCCHTSSRRKRESCAAAIATAIADLDPENAEADPDTYCSRYWWEKTNTDIAESGLDGTAAAAAATAAAAVSGSSDMIAGVVNTSVAPSSSSAGSTDKRTSRRSRSASSSSDSITALRSQLAEAHERIAGLEDEVAFLRQSFAELRRNSTFGAVVSTASVSKRCLPQTRTRSETKELLKRETVKDIIPGHVLSSKDRKDMNIEAKGNVDAKTWRDKLSSLDMSIRAIRDAIQASTGKKRTFSSVMRRARVLLKRADASGSGTVSFQQFRRVMRENLELDISFRDTFEQMGVLRSGKIAYDELLSAVEQRSSLIYPSLGSDKE